MNSDLRWTVVSTASTALAALAAGKVAELGWKLVTGREAPRNADEEATLMSVVLFAAASAAVVTVAQHYTTRRTRSWYAAKYAQIEV